MKVHELIEYLQNSPQGWSVYVEIKGWECTVEVHHLIEDSGVGIVLDPVEFSGINSRVASPFKELPTDKIE